jgi:asparagine synthase (glutamine-hydrolysing)
MDSTAIAEALEDGILRTVGDVARFSVLFSGGLDSSIIAWVLRGTERLSALVTISLPGGSDLAAAESAAGLIGLDHLPFLLTPEEVTETAALVRGQFPDLSLNDLSVQTCMAIASGKAEDRVVLCGQGADELFLGYAHSKDLSGDALEARAQKDLEKLLTRDWPTSVELARARGKEMRAPYLDPRIIENASMVPWDDRHHGNERKWLLKEAASALGMPRELIDRPKRAFQYGSGVHRVLRRSLRA